MDLRYDYTLVLAGNPNCGKSAVFNALTGSNQRLGNWPGVTVDQKEGFFTKEGKVYRVIDLPGTYNLKPYSEDEEVTCSYLMKEKIDLIVNVIDASNLERNLFLSMQLMEMNRPMAFVVNMMDVAEENGISINIPMFCKKLEALAKDLPKEPVISEIACVYEEQSLLSIQIPLVAVSAVKKGSAMPLINCVWEALTEPYYPSLHIAYPANIEHYVKSWKKLVTKTAEFFELSTRCVIIKLLEGDKVVMAKSLEIKEITHDIVQLAKREIRNEYGITAQTMIVQSRHALAREVMASVSTMSELKKNTLTDIIDRFVLHKYVGIPIFFMMMYLLFWAVIKLSAPFQGFFDDLAGVLFIDAPRFLLERWGMAGWVVSLVSDAMGTGLQTVSGFIPLTFIMFLGLSLLEESGYMARAAFIMDRAMRQMGLPGKAFVPLIVGFGCTVPAIMGTRTLNSRRDRVLTIFMSSFMSCGARLPVYALFGSAFFGSQAVFMTFSLYLVGILFAVLTGLILNRSLPKSQHGHFMMELPLYHRPRWGTVLRLSAHRVKGFVLRAGQFIVIAVFIIGLLNSFNFKGALVDNPNDSALATLGKTLTPIFSPFGVEQENWPATVGLITGFVAKEAIISTITAIYGHNSGMMGDNEEEGVNDQSFGSFLINGISDVVLSFPTMVIDNFSEAVISADSGQTKEEESMLMQNLVAGFRLGKWHAYAYLLFVLLYVPCLAATGAIYKELSKVLTAILISYLTLLAWAVATLFYQIVLGHSLLWIFVALGILAMIFLFFFMMGSKTFEEKINRHVIKQ